MVIVIGLQPAALWSPRAVRMGLICFQSGRHVRQLYQAFTFLFNSCYGIFGFIGTFCFKGTETVQVTLLRRTLVSSP